jgi:hypothetical protein
METSAQQYQLMGSSRWHEDNWKRVTNPAGGNGWQASKRYKEVGIPTVYQAIQSFPFLHPPLTDSY